MRFVVAIGRICLQKSKESAKWPIYVEIEIYNMPTARQLPNAKIHNCNHSSSTLLGRLLAAYRIQFSCFHTAYTIPSTADVWCVTTIFFTLVHLICIRLQRLLYELKSHFSVTHYFRYRTMFQVYFQVLFILMAFLIIYIEWFLCRLQFFLSACSL